MKKLAPATRGKKAKIPSDDENDALKKEMMKLNKTKCLPHRFRFTQNEPIIALTIHKKNVYILIQQTSLLVVKDIIAVGQNCLPKSEPI